MDASVSFPPELQQALARFRRRWWLLQTLMLLGLCLFVPLCSFALLVLSDRVWATPGAVRMLLAGPVPVLLAVFAWPWLRRWVLRRPDARVIAKVMGRLDRRVGDRLLGAVELSQGGGDAGDSPALRRAAIEQVARELASVRAEEKLDTSRLRVLSRVTTLLLLAGTAYVLWVPEAARNSFRRWLRPHRPIERFTFVRFEGFPERLTVAHGEPYALEGRVRHVREAAVEGVEVRLEGPERVEWTLSEGSLSVAGEGLTQERRLVLRSGDARRDVAVVPMLRPELVGLEAVVEWPGYLAREPEVRELRRRRVEVPEGSRVALRGTVSRDLRGARVQEGPRLEVEGAVFRVPAVEVRADRRVEVLWEDVEGLGPREAAVVELAGREDGAPDVSIVNLPPAIAVLPEEFVTFEVQGRDDYGLTRMWTRMGVRGEGAAAPVEEGLEVSGVSGAAEVTFSPLRAGFGPGDLIELTALALDAFPGREPSVSARHRILVMSHEEHAKMVRQQMDGVLAELDEVIREEALALEENRALVEAGEEAMAEDAAAEGLVDRAMEEVLRAERLREAQRRMEGLIAEGAKNETISDEAIAEWTEISEALGNEAQPAMQAAARAMQAAAEASGQPGEAGESGEAGEAGEAEASEREQQVREAMEQQEAAIAAMRQGEEDLNESLEESLSESFVNRFRELARIQGEIGEAMQGLLPETIGLTPEELPEELAERVRAEAERQGEILREARYVYDDLEGFYRRTREEVLREVTGEMDAERFQTRLPALRELMLENVIGRTTGEAREWSGSFAAWAEKLAGEEDAGGGEGGGESGDQEGEDLETMVALVRARERQERLRRHTRALDESYAENLNYGREAVALSDEQYDLGTNLQKLENRVKTEDVKKLISLASGEIMNAGVQLRRPQTDSETRAVQTAVIELLAAALDQSMSGSPPPEGSGGEPQESAQQQNQRMMQALMQMMAGRQPGDQGGEGSTGFGDPGEARFGRPGAAAGRGESGEGKAGAANPERWPGEYRGWMDAYYEAMEGGE